MLKKGAFNNIYFLLIYLTELITIRIGNTKVLVMEIGFLYEFVILCDFWR